MNDYVPYLAFVCIIAYQVKFYRLKRSKNISSDTGGNTVNGSSLKSSKSLKGILDGELLYQDNVPQIYLHKLVSLSDSFESKNLGNT